MSLLTLIVCGRPLSRVIWLTTFTKFLFLPVLNHLSRKSASFQSRANFEPLSISLQDSLRFFQSLMPTGYCITKTYLTYLITQESIGFSQSYTLASSYCLRFYLYSEDIGLFVKQYENLLNPISHLLVIVYQPNFTIHV